MHRGWRAPAALDRWRVELTPSTLPVKYCLPVRTMQRINVETRRLVGGALCLDFANSVDWASDRTERPSHTEVLIEPADLAGWGKRVGLVDPEIALIVTGRELGAARRLRAAIHRAFAVLAPGEAPA